MVNHKIHFLFKIYLLIGFLEKINTELPLLTEGSLKKQKAESYIF